MMQGCIWTARPRKADQARAHPVRSVVLPYVWHAMAWRAMMDEALVERLRV
jgi:hypothetical protein